MGESKGMWTRLGAARKLRRRQYEQGVTLLELSMVLVIMAAIIGGAVMLYTTTAASNRLKDAITELGAIQTTVQAAYGNQDTYEGLKTDQVLKSNFIPARMKNDTEILTPWNTGVTVAAGTDPNHKTYTITFSVPENECITLYGSANNLLGLTSIAINTQLVKNVAEAQVQCIAMGTGSGGTRVHDITWTMQKP